MFELLKQQKVQFALVAIFSLGLNWNTFTNKYALDDEIVIHQNLNVQAGISGIDEILTTDAFQGYLDMAGMESPLTGGRYRPLSIVTFAIEQSFGGVTLGDEYRQEQENMRKLERHGGTEKELAAQITKMDELKTKMEEGTLKLAPLRHVVQVLLFMLSMIVLIIFLNKHVFPEKPLLSLLTVVFFIAHPVHTEVIANIKSRDEILSLLFCVLTLHYSFNYFREKGIGNLLRMTVCFLLALLSKEYALILPFVAVIGWKTLLKDRNLPILNPAFGILAILTGLFAMIRFTAFNNVDSVNSTADVLNDPYLYATSSEAFASKVSIVLEYLRVLLFPKDLSSDYSYNHFTYIDTNHWKFWLSGLIYIGLGVAFLLVWRKKSPLAFALGLFLGCFFLVNNLLFNIGATMGERLVYHSSLGLCLLVVFLGNGLYERLKVSEMVKRVIVLLVLLPVVGLMSCRTIDRNPDWESDYTLFTRDVKTVPNSALANCNAGTESYNKLFSEYSKLKKPTDVQTATFRLKLKRIIPYFDKAISIHGKYVVAYMNRGLCYFRSGNKDKAAEDWVKAAELFNGSHPFLKRNAYVFLDEGLELGSQKRYKEAVKPLQIAAAMNPDDAVIWNNLGGSLFMTGQFKLAAEAFGKALTINPSLQDALQGKNAAAAIYQLEQKVIANPDNVAAKNELKVVYAGCGVSPELLTVKI